MRDSHFNCFALLHLLDARSLASRHSIAFKWQKVCFAFNNTYQEAHPATRISSQYYRSYRQSQAIQWLWSLLSEGFVEKTERKGKRMSCFFGGDWKARKRNMGGCMHLFIGDHINLHWLLENTETDNSSVSLIKDQSTCVESTQIGRTYLIWTIARFH